MAKLNSNTIPSAVRKLHKIMVLKKWTLACAESCTGGRVSAAITSRPGVSAFFLGAIISYHGSVKHKILRVPSSLLRRHGEVSEPVALAMATGVRRALGSDWSVAITGVAGPSGGTVSKPVGMVCFAVVGPKYKKVVTKYFSENLAREQIQNLSTQMSLKLLLNAVG